jgi:hypothetical protein
MGKMIDVPNTPAVPPAMIFAHSGTMTSSGMLPREKRGQDTKRTHESVK